MMTCSLGRVLQTRFGQGLAKGVETHSGPNLLHTSRSLWRTHDETLRDDRRRNDVVCALVDATARPALGSRRTRSDDGARRSAWAGGGMNRCVRNTAETTSIVRNVKTNKQPSHCVRLSALLGSRKTEMTVEKIFRVVVTVVSTRTSKCVFV